MNTIGLLGNIGSGKNTVAQYLATKGCIPTSFAGPLKDLCASIFGWERELLEGSAIKSHEGMMYGRMYADWKVRKGSEE